MSVLWFACHFLLPTFIFSVKWVLKWHTCRPVRDKNVISYIRAAGWSIKCKEDQVIAVLNDHLPVALLAQLVRALHRYRRGQGFESSSGFLFATAKVVPITAMVFFTFKFQFWTKWLELKRIGEEQPYRVYTRRMLRVGNKDTSREQLRSNRMFLFSRFRILRVMWTRTT